MDLRSLRSKARAIMAVGSAMVFAGVGIMLHGELNFGDGVLVAGIILFIIGVILLAQTPTGDDDAG